MRIVDVSGGPGGEHPTAGSQSAGQQSRSTLLGPESAPEPHQFASQVLGIFAARQARKTAQSQDLRSGGQPGAETIRTARRTGAKHAVDDLGGRLGDDWVLLRGYHNAAGPIGQVLIGPSGVVAITSLHLDAAVHCHGDKWEAELAAGHQPVHLDDHDGRSPSTQLNQSADVLEQQLRSVGAIIGVQRAILLNHPAAREGKITRPTVRVFTSAADLAAWLHSLPKTLDRGAKRHLEELFTRTDRQGPAAPG